MSNYNRDPKKDTVDVLATKIDMLSQDISEIKGIIGNLHNEIKDLPAYKDRIDHSKESINGIKRRIDDNILHKPENCPNKSHINKLWMVIIGINIPIVLSWIGIIYIFVDS